MDSRIALVAKRQPDLEQGRSDYHVYAGEQIVGRIYQTASASWLWAVNSVTMDMAVGEPTRGYGHTFEEARADLRLGFERWLAWALTIQPDDLRYGPLDRNLRAVGVR